jgi:hypothetical protein
MYDTEYTPFQTFMFFFVIIAMFVGFGIFVYVNKDKPKLEAREMTQSEETLNKAILFNRLGIFNTTQNTVPLK